MSNDKKPHVAVLNINIELYDILDSGEVSGNLKKAEDLDSKILVRIDGFDKQDCIKNVKKKIEELLK